MKKIIIDCDPGIDDVIAIVMALKCPKLQVLGITIASGNVPSDIGAANALKAIDMAQTYAPPVYIGSKAPISKPYFSAEDTHGGNGLGNSNLEWSGQVQRGCGIDFILSTVHENPKEVSICAIGPLTNIALCMERDLEKLSNTKEIVMMGGCARVHGNCSSVAEFNYYCDPHAAEKTFKSGIPLVMVGLDVTYQIVLTPNLREILKQWNTKTSNDLYSITEFYVDFHWTHEKTIGCVINDPLAIAYLIDEKVLGTFEAYVDVVTEGKAEGQSLVDFNLVWGNPNAKVAMDVDTRLAMELILETIFPDKIDDIKIALDFDLEKKRYGCRF